RVSSSIFAGVVDSRAAPARRRWTRYALCVTILCPREKTPGTGPMSGHAEPRVIRFGVFEVDLKTGELRKHGSRVKLRDQSFRVLALLLARPGELVSREDLRRELWPG